MKLLYDENLPPRLVQSLSDIYAESKHVHDLQLGGADDSTLWAYARANGFAIVSKDSDFAERSVLESGPPKVVWIRLGNCSTADIETLLRTEHETLRTFVEKDKEVCLILGRR